MWLSGRERRIRTCFARNGVSFRLVVPDLFYPISLWWMNRVMFPWLPCASMRELITEWYCQTAETFFLTLHYSPFYYFVSFYTFYHLINSIIAGIHFIILSVVISLILLWFVIHIFILFTTRPLYVVIALLFTCYSLVLLLRNSCIFLSIVELYCFCSNLFTFVIHSHFMFCYIMAYFSNLLYIYYVSY